LIYKLLFHSSFIFEYELSLCILIEIVSLGIGENSKKWMIYVLSLTQIHNSYVHLLLKCFGSQDQGNFHDGNGLNRLVVVTTDYEQCEFQQIPL
jgi:hypothetical protein